MSDKSQTAISPTRLQDYPEWYQQVIKAADLAEVSPVRGCMIIKPWGYALWENMQKVLDRKFKETGHVNAYFPLLIPLSYLQKEAQHVEGFAKECAVVTHHRLQTNDDGQLIPAGELEEPFIIRPTSETIIGAAYAKWVQSYRDLPILINQWANVMRWEMRTRLFLRTAEFLWQEGHTAHATKEEAVDETMKMLDVYADFAENYMAMPVLKGEKTPEERFPGAVNTYAIEAMMQDRKALQAGTSHFLGQNFAKASEIQFADQNGQTQFAWTTSWGVSTRLIGGLIMSHSDDDGLVLPPKLAPIHVVILPIYRNDEEKSKVLTFCNQLKRRISELHFSDGLGLNAHVDDRDLRGGEKSWYHIKRGVPIRVEVGPRDLEKNQIVVMRRDRGPKDKAFVSTEQFTSEVVATLQSIQDRLFETARERLSQHTIDLDERKTFADFFTAKNNSKPEVHGGFARAFLDTADSHVQGFLKELKVTARCIPLGDAKLKGKCFISGRDVTGRIVFAKAY